MLAATSPRLLPRPGVGAASHSRFFHDPPRLVLASQGSETSLSTVHSDSSVGTRHGFCPLLQGPG